MGGGKSGPGVKMNRHLVACFGTVFFVSSEWMVEGDDIIYQSLLLFARGTRVDFGVWWEYGWEGNRSVYAQRIYGLVWIPCTLS